MVEWETGEKIEELLSIIAQDDPVACATYAKEQKLLHLPRWSKLKHIAKHLKPLLELSTKPRKGKLGGLQRNILGV